MKDQPHPKLILPNRVIDINMSDNNILVLFAGLDETWARFRFNKSVDTVSGIGQNPASFKYNIQVNSVIFVIVLS
jgi:hypothetical protein